MKKIGLLFFSLFIILQAQAQHPLEGTWVRTGDAWKGMRIKVYKDLDGSLVGKLIYVPAIAQKSGFSYGKFKWKSFVKLQNGRYKYLDLYHTGLGMQYKTHILVFEGKNIIKSSAIDPTNVAMGVIQHWQRAEPPKQDKKEDIKQDENPIVVQKKEDKKVVMPTKIGDRKYKVKNEIYVKNRNIKLYIRDNETVDGDRISISFDNEWILENYTLDRKTKELSLEIKDDGGYFVLYALNLGKYPPNTAQVFIDDGYNQYKVTLSSDLDESGAIRIKYKP